MKTSPGMVGELIDWFGSSVAFTDITEDSILARVKVNLQAMKYWAMQYAPYVTILSPQSLVDEVKDGLRKALSEYETI